MEETEAFPSAWVCAAVSLTVLYLKPSQNASQRSPVASPHSVTAAPAGSRVNNAAHYVRISWASPTDRARIPTYLYRGGLLQCFQLWARHRLQARETFPSTSNPRAWSSQLSHVVHRHSRNGTTVFPVASQISTWPTPCLSSPFFSFHIMSVVHECRYHFDAT